MNHPSRSDRHQKSQSTIGGNKLKLGKLGEELACQYFRESGFDVVSRNYRLGNRGELDLVVCDRTTVVAVEVKTRRGLSYGHPLESITHLKLNRLRVLLSEWARMHPEISSDRMLRIDGFGVLLRQGYAPKIHHLPGLVEL